MLTFQHGLMCPVINIEIFLQFRHLDICLKIDRNRYKKINNMHYIYLALIIIIRYFRLLIEEIKTNSKVSNS